MEENYVHLKEIEWKSIMPQEDSDVNRVARDVGDKSQVSV